ncbi:MAG: glycosyltransferase [Clostridia bacterium]|nr:glycosyltransferase [Clostridia bacterium]
MEKKKILFVINNMNVGGIQKSLLELLKALSKDEQYELSLFCSKRAGKFLSLVPENVNILPENKYARLTEESVSSAKRLGKIMALKRAYYSFLSKKFTKEKPVRKICKKIGKLEGFWDLAVAYAQPIEDRAFNNICNEIVLNCVDAKKKATFLHCDFSMYGGNTARNRALYEKFDKIGACSNSVGEKFKGCVPSVADRVRTVYNLCDVEQIKLLSEEDTVVYDKPTIVTVARLSSEKGHERVLSALKRIKDEGVDFCWSVVGGGSLDAKIKEKIKEFGLEEYVVMHGEQTNPYRYVKGADFLLLSSYHEAAPIVFDEAMVLGVTVLSTETLSARELVEGRDIGYVCENSEEGLYKLIKDALCKNIAKKDKKILDSNARKKQFDALVEGKDEK